MNKINILKSNDDYKRLAKFIINENYSHHQPDDKFSELKIQLLYNEELSYKRNSTVYAIEDYHHDLIGTIRVLKWNYLDTLPIEKIFQINPLHFLEENSQANIWHIGRFAIKKNQGILPLKKLITLAISKVCDNKGNIAFAECDARLLKILFLMDINPKVIGKPKHHLGSETFPILLTYEDLERFLFKNKYLINSDNEELFFCHQHGKNRVLEQNNTNYSFA